MVSRKYGRTRGSAASDASALSPSAEAQQAERTPELRLVCTSWRSFARLQDELREFDALTLPLSSGPDGSILLTIETPEGDVVRLPAFLTGGVLGDGGSPEALLVRVDLDDALREELDGHAAHGNALVHDDVERLERVRQESIGAYRVSSSVKRRARQLTPRAVSGAISIEPEATDGSRESQRPTQPAPAETSETLPKP